MAIFSLKDLEDTKASLKSAVAELHQQYAELIAYSEKMPNTNIRRPIFLIKCKNDLTKIKRAISKIKEMNDQILVATGKKLTLMPVPVLMEDIAMVRVWVNKAVSSRTNTTKREDIMSRLNDFINVANKYDNSINRSKVKALRKELDFFSNETEDVYRVRSFGNTDVISRIYFDNCDELRLRLTAGGLFVCAKDFGQVRIITPSERAPRKKRPSIFDNLTPISFSGTLGAQLYRESEVEREKEIQNFDKSKTIDKVKNSKKKKVTEEIKAD